MLQYLGYFSDLCPVFIYALRFNDFLFMTNPLEAADETVALFLFGFLRSYDRTSFAGFFCFTLPLEEHQVLQNQSCVAKDPGDIFLAAGFQNLRQYHDS
jgi:hypothetical protein